MLISQVSNGVMDDYRAKMNSRSLDGLPGLRVARKDKGEYLWIRDLEAQVRKYDGLRLGLVALISSFFTLVAAYLLGCLELPDVRLAV
jgi:hypothetical protein